MGYCKAGPRLPRNSMHLASAAVVLIHLLYAIAQAAPTRLDDKLSPRGVPQSSQSEPGSENKPPGHVQQAVESLTKDHYIGEVFTGHLYRLPNPFDGQRAVVKVTSSHEYREGDKLDPETIRDTSIKSLEMVQQYLGLGVMRMKGFIINLIVMEDMGYTVEEMERKKVPWGVLQYAAVDAINWYRKKYAMEISGVENLKSPASKFKQPTEALKNFAFKEAENGKVTARIIGWHSGKVVQGITPEIKVNLGETKFPEEHWVARSVNQHFLLVNTILTPSWM